MANRKLTGNFSELCCRTSNIPWQQTCFTWRWKEREIERVYNPCPIHLDCLYCYGFCKCELSTFGRRMSMLTKFGAHLGERKGRKR